GSHDGLLLCAAEGLEAGGALVGRAGGARGTQGDGQLELASGRRRERQTLADRLQAERPLLALGEGECVQPVGLGHLVLAVGERGLLALLHERGGRNVRADGGATAGGAELQVYVLRQGRVGRDGELARELEGRRRSFGREASAADGEGHAGGAGAAVGILEVGQAVAVVVDAVAADLGRGAAFRAVTGCVRAHTGGADGVGAGVVVGGAGGAVGRVVRLAGPRAVARGIVAGGIGAVAARGAERGDVGLAGAGAVTRVGPVAGAVGRVAAGRGGRGEGCLARPGPVAGGGVGALP